jgi:myo-inositol-1(or 4)-monophosphatase
VSETLDKLIELCAGLRAVVTPFLGLHAARDHAGVAVGGDTTFDIDEKAEAFLETYMAERLPTWAYYSEDRGLQGAVEPDLILIVDPIDGTRPAAAGLEAAMVSIAAVPPSAVPTMGDVVAGVMQEIRSGDLFAAEKGAGFSMRRAADGAGIPFLPSPLTDIESLFWTLGFRGRPALVLAGVLEELIDRSSVRGSVFDIGSATFSITRILTGQLDAYVDIGPAIITAHPRAEAEFRRVGLGGVLCNSPYDLAAAYLVCREAGIPISDADGSSLDEKPVLGSDASYQMACIAAGNADLHATLVEAVRRGISRYRFLDAPATRGNPFAIGG